MAKKFSSRYKVGFKEGYNNPKASVENISKILESGRKFTNEKARDFFDGMVSGVAVKERELSQGINNGMARYITNDKALMERIE